MDQYKLFLQTLVKTIDYHHHEYMIRLVHEYMQSWEVINNVYRENAQRVMISKALEPMDELIKIEVLPPHKAVY
jgi:hypothetical protein